MRDLGGLRSTYGLLKRGVVVRASTLGSLTAAGLAAMRAHSVKTVIDLRGPAEIAVQPSPFAVDVAYRNVWVDREQTLKLHEHAIAGTMDQQLAALARPDSGLRDAFGELAAADPAIVLHCQAGRDRTGIVIALLLAGLGVPHDDIVADYRASDDELVSEYERFSSEHPEVAADMAERQSRRAWVIGELLGAIRAQYSHATEYLTTIGVQPAELRRLREMLVA